MIHVLDTLEEHAAKVLVVQLGDPNTLGSSRGEEGTNRLQYRRNSKKWEGKRPCT